MKRITTMLMIVVLSILVQNHLVSAKVSTITQGKLIYISHIINNTGSVNGNWRGLKIVLGPLIYRTTVYDEIYTSNCKISLDTTSHYRHSPEAILLYAGINTRFPTSIACFASMSEDNEKSFSCSILKKLFEVRPGEVEYLDDDPRVSIELIPDSVAPPNNQRALEFHLTFNPLP